MCFPAITSNSVLRLLNSLEHRQTITGSRAHALRQTRALKPLDAQTQVHHKLLDAQTHAYHQIGVRSLSLNHTI